MSNLRRDGRRFREDIDGLRHGRRDRSRPGLDASLFAAARLAVDRHDARAETFLSIYLRRFPTGANVEDARQLLARVTQPQGGH